MKHIIKVTREDIENGEPDSSGSCPIALATRRAGVVNLNSDIYVTGDRILFSNRFARLPLKASLFIEEFDLGEVVMPFEFTIEIEKTNKVEKTK